VTASSPREQGGLRSVLVGVLANIFLAIVKGTAGVLGNCYALVADAIESTADIFASVVVYQGLRIAREPPDEDHPYGHGKAEPLVSLVVAAFLVLAGIAVAIQSVREILHPHFTPAPFTLLVLVGVVLIKELLSRRLTREGRALDSTALATEGWHHRSDALTSGAAFIGIAIALAGGPGWESADDWAALLASAVILANAARIARPALAEAMDAAPPREIESSVRAAARGVEGVRGLDLCRIRKNGLDLFVDLHIFVDGEMTVTQGHAIAHRTKDAVRAAQPRVRDVLVHVEPVEPAKR